MQLFLGLLFFSTLLATGASLTCETCAGVGNHCSGPQVPCSAGQDTCAVALSETSLGVTVHTVVKGCESSNVCELDIFSATIGTGKTSRVKTVCCTGGACKSVIPKLPPINSQPNGRQCPACYSLTDSCPAEVVHCTGSEDHCFELGTRESIDGTPIQISMKGCTTAHVCGQLRTGNRNFGRVGVAVTKVECWQASQSPPLMGYSLLALSGLLAMKTIF